jgi:hypothetical protein
MNQALYAHINNKRKRKKKKRKSQQSENFRAYITLKSHEKLQLLTLMVFGHLGIAKMTLNTSFEVNYLELFIVPLL